MATHSSILAWKIPWMEGPGGLLWVHRVAMSQAWLSNFTFTFHFPALEKEMATHSSVLAWRIPGMEEAVGLPSMGLHRVGHDWSDLAAAAAAAASLSIKWHGGTNHVLKTIFHQIMWLVSNLWFDHILVKLFQKLFCKRCHLSCLCKNGTSNITWSQPVQVFSVQFSSVPQLCLTLCDPMDCSMPGFPVHYQLLELAQTHIHQVGDAIQPSHPLLSLSLPAFNLSQHQGLFQWVSSSHQVAKVFEFELQLQSFQWIFRTDFL